MAQINCPNCGSNLTQAELDDNICFDCKEGLPEPSEYDPEIDDETQD